MPLLILVFWDKLVWALMVLAEGRHPSEDFDGDVFVDGPRAELAGTDIAGGMIFVVWMIRADLDFLANSLKLENCNGAGGMCVWCKANNLEMPFGGLGDRI